jgi:SMP-30/Gluconolactonase/LRE-like region
MRFAHNRSPFVATGRDQADTLIAKRRQNCGGGVARIVAEGAGDSVRNGTCANNRSHMRVFDVDHEGGKVSNGKVFAEMPKPSITDGVRTDTAGNVWCSCGWGDPNDDGVRCYNAAGDLLGKIHIPETVANLCFGGDFQKPSTSAAGAALCAVYTSATNAMKP